MKKITLISTFAAAVILLVTSVMAKPVKQADPAENGPAVIQINELQKRYPAVRFDHFKHASIKGYKIKCTTCHHKSKGTDVESTCSDCHKAKREGRRLALKGAFHKRCIACHVSYNKKMKKELAPHKCSGCHVKSKKADTKK